MILARGGALMVESLLSKKCIRSALLNTAYIFKDLLYNYLDWMRKKSV